MLGLSACSTTSPSPILNPIKPEPKVPPVEYVTKCDINLPVSGINKEQWASLTPEGQWEYVKTNIAAPWATTYKECALRHNLFIDWYFNVVR